MATSLDEALAYLDASVNLEATPHGRPTPKPTLDRMERLVGLLGDPQHAAPVVHITGTNGKGSTARMTSALLAAHGLTVGTYTSPDLERVNERLSRNLEPIADEELADVIAAVAELERHSGIVPTRFEILTLAAFRWFADVAVDVVVLEVGMAGRWDATNVADGQVAVITTIGLDHTEVLGPTRRHIAEEKVGIVKAGSTFVLGEDDPDLAPVFDASPAARILRRPDDFVVDANRLAVGGRALDLSTPTARYDDVYLSLHGAHQGENALLAAVATESFFERPLDEDVLRETFGSITMPGRFEVISRRPLLVLDGAHNADGAAAAAATLDDLDPGGDRILVVGASGARDPVELLTALEATRARVVIACAADTPRAVPAEEVAAAARSLGVATRVVPSVEAAVDEALAEADVDDVVLVTGSLYVAGAARRHAKIPS